MNDAAILFLSFFFCFVLGVFIMWGIETLIKRRKAHKQYLRRLEEENKRLKSTVALYGLELLSKDGKIF